MNNGIPFGANGNLHELKNKQGCFLTKKTGKSRPIFALPSRLWIVRRPLVNKIYLTFPAHSAVALSAVTYQQLRLSLAIFAARRYQQIGS